MDFWSRLIGGAGTQKQQPYSQKKSPQQRLDRFKRVYNDILQTCSRPQVLARPGPAVEQLYTCLRQLSAALKDETRAPAPHTCYSFTASSQVYAVIARAASACKDERIIAEAITVFSLLVDNEGDNFTGSRPFGKALTRFADRLLGSGNTFIGEETEAHLVEVLFGVAARIRLEPDILSVWFSGISRSDRDEVYDREKRSFVGTTQKDDFPLCYLFIDRVHHEGRIGDFARTGLLYIFEVASTSPVLEEWIVDSDLATLMASGLGALYSQMSRELSLLHDQNDLPALLALSDYLELHTPSDAENVRSELHVAHMSTFLSHLAFWQDVLDHCKSQDVKQTLLDHFQILFLQQLLYPSLLQSSDTDGGSSVAVLTYMTSMLQAISHPDMVHMMLQYLLAIPEKRQSRPAMPRSSPSVTRRRSSLMVMTASTEDSILEPTLFNLVDLVSNGLQSVNTQTVYASLKLCSSLLSRHRSYALPALISCNDRTSHKSERTIGALAVETQNLIALSCLIGGSEGMDEAYSGACLDISPALELQLMEHDKTSQTGADAVVPAGGSKLQLRILDAKGPCLAAIMSLVSSFLTNNIDTNLALTEAVLNISMCRDIALDGWLAVVPTNYVYDLAADQASGDEVTDGDLFDEEEKLVLAALRASTRTPTWANEQDPGLVKVLKELRVQVDRLRSTYKRFDQMLVKRKTILQANDHALDGLITERHDELPVPTQWSGRGHIRKTSQASSRTASPVRSVQSNRGRQRQDRTLRSPASSISSQHRGVVSPSRLSNSVFRPPPPDHPSSPPQLTLDAVIAEAQPENEAELLTEKIRFPLASQNGTGTGEEAESENEASIRSVTLSHVLTNVVVLQSFALELAAVMQLRACLFEEVKFA